MLADSVMAFGLEKINVGEWKMFKKKKNRMKESRGKIRGYFKMF